MLNTKAAPQKNFFEEKEKELIMKDNLRARHPYISLRARLGSSGRRARVGPGTAIPPGFGKEMGMKASASRANFPRKFLHAFFCLNLGRRLLPFGHE
jgi:hypothetical protein